MKALVAKLRPGTWVGKKVFMAVSVAGIAAAAFFWGRHGAGGRATAQAPAQHQYTQAPQAMPAAATDYQRRVVAFLYGNIPVTREELGEYLIARYGAERVEFLVNSRIIQMACRDRNIQVTDAEVDAQLREDLKGFGNISEKDFVNGILKRYHKTLYEWREDVIRPKLALQRFCKDRVQVTEDDILKAFDAKFGEKIHCRMIVLPKEWAGTHRATDIWTKVSKNDEEFNKAARSQFIPDLAAKGGEIPPIHKHFGDPKVEKAAFELKTPGEVTPLMTMPDGNQIILKLVKRQPPDTTRKLNDVRLDLHKEMFEVKLAQEIPKVFQDLRTRANPTILLKKESATTSRQELDRQVRQQLQGTPGIPAPPAAAPRGQ